MYSILKYLNFLSVLVCAGCLLSSCSSDIPEKTDNGTGGEVSFAVKEETRASVTTTIDRFAVFGDMKTPGEDSSSPSLVFDQTEVEKTDNGWVYQGTKYWYPDHEHSFVAIHPLSVLADENDPQYADSKLTFSYTLPISGDNLVNDKEVDDIIAATHRRLYDKSDAGSIIVLHFGHLLSLINFTLGLSNNMMAADEYFLFHKLELRGFSTSASIGILPAERQLNNATDDAVTDIYDQHGDGRMVINFEEPIKVMNGDENISVFDAGDAIIMLPQTLASNAEIAFTYTKNDEEQPREIKISIKGLVWESGKSYTYKFNISKTGMLVGDVSISDWKNVEGNPAEAW